MPLPQMFWPKVLTQGRCSKSRSDCIQLNTALTLELYGSALASPLDHFSYLQVVNHSIGLSPISDYPITVCWATRRRNGCFARNIFQSILHSLPRWVPRNGANSHWIIGSFQLYGRCLPYLHLPGHCALGDRKTVEAATDALSGPSSRV